jgi:glycosyltransferase involved in cell wall biosynthesis
MGIEAWPMQTDTFTLEKLPVQRPHLRVAVVTETYPPEVNGVAMTIGRMVEGLRQRDHQIQLIRPQQNSADQPADEASLSHHLQRGMSIPRYQGLKMGLPAKAGLSKLWAEQRPDVVHIATEGPLGWSALSAANKLRIPAVTDFHTNFHSYSAHYGLGFLRPAIVAYLRKFHNKAALTLIPTDGILQELTRHGYRNLGLLARGVDARLFDPQRRSAALRSQWGATDDDPVVLYVGRLAAEKNLDLVFKAFTAMREQAPNARLVLVGDGPDLGLWQARQPEARFCGAKTGAELASHYASADIFLFPSLTETYGNVTMEALASGLAVVAFDYAAAKAHIRDAANGLKASPGDEDEFIRKSLQALDPELRRRLQAAARHSVQDLSWEKIHQQFERILLSLVRT